MPSVALLLTGRSSSVLEGVGAAVVVREDGVLLTAYHVIKDAKALQVRFKNGETFDNVQLLGVDDRRGVAALRISASGLPAISVADPGGAKAGDQVWVISHAEALPWSSSTGIVSAFRLADEVPGAGKGFRVLQFTAPVSPGSSGGIVLDAEGRGLGLILGSLEGGQNLNFAVPISSVLGLADSPVARAFDPGSGLQLPSEGASGRAGAPTPTAPAETPKAEPHAEDLDKSEVLKSKDPDFILRHFRTMFVSVNDRAAAFFGSDQLKASLQANKDFAGLHVAVVDDPTLADVVLEVGYTFAWDYPFTLRHQNTTLVLLAGKGTGPFSGPRGATSVAKQLVKLLKPYRSNPSTP